MDIRQGSSAFEGGGIVGLVAASIDGLDGVLLRGIVGGGQPIKLLSPRQTIRHGRIILVVGAIEMHGGVALGRAVDVVAAEHHALVGVTCSIVEDAAVDVHFGGAVFDGFHFGDGGIAWVGDTAQAAAIDVAVDGSFVHVHRGLVGTGEAGHLVVHATQGRAAVHVAPNGWAA